MPDAHQDNWLRDALGVDLGQVTVGVVAGAAPATGNDAESAEYAQAMEALNAEVRRLAEAGLNAGPYAAQAKSLRDAYAMVLKKVSHAQRAAAMGRLLRLAKAAAMDAKKDVARVTVSAGEGIDKAVVEMRDGAAAIIDKLPLDSTEKSDLTKRLQDLDAAIAEVDAVTERPDRARRLKEANAAAESLFDAAAAAAKDRRAVQHVYRQALKSRYGIEIDNRKNAKRLYLQQIYEALDKVPEADVVQSRFKTLAYEPAILGEAGYENATIIMGRILGDEMDYVDPATGKKMTLNAPSLFALHELGHSVDDRFKIMVANSGKPGGGGWRTETVASVARVLLAHFKPAKDFPSFHDSSYVWDDLRAVIEYVLKHGQDPDKPDWMNDDDWWALGRFLDECIELRQEKQPWEKLHDLHGRSYHEAYKDEWVSYETAARVQKALTVRGYQWRSPGEWFAELYAFTWFNAKPPPEAVDPAIAAYLYGGKAAGAASPSGK